MKRIPVVDLHRLPSWLQYLISLATIASIAVLAWLAGRDEPIPRWVGEWLVPNLIWVFAGLVIIAVAGTVVERKRRKRSNDHR